jgi:hypothetical protein
VIAGGDDRREVLDAGRLVGDEEVLADLVLVTTEARLLVREAREALRLGAHGDAHRLDDLLSLLDLDRRERKERGARGAHGLVDAAEDAVAEPRARRGTLRVRVRRRGRAAAPDQALRDRLRDAPEVALVHALGHRSPPRSGVGIAVLLAVLLVERLPADLP